MARTNKNTSGVFINIVGDDNEIPTYDMFLKSQDKLKKPSKELKPYIDKYKDLITKNRLIFEEMAKLEDKILQHRVMENINPSEIKFSILREYIYARIPFHRRDKDAKDVRALIGLTSIYGTDINKLYENKNFMDITITKLKKSMTEAIKLTEKVK